MTARRSLIGLVLLVALVAAALPIDPAQAVTVSLEQLPPAIVANETKANLEAQGCIERPLSNTPDVPPGQPYIVQARDTQPGFVHFCTPDVRAQLTAVNGQVLQIINTGDIANAIKQTTLFDGTWDLRDLKFLEQASSNVVNNTVTSKLTDIYIYQMTVIGQVGTIVFDWAVAALKFSLITPGGFIQNPMVTKVWPFVQGIANVGFMLALLFIALATTLQIRNFGVARMLPRLLIAALLINFSLVIAGVLIGLTQIAMAVMFNALVGSSLDNAAESFKVAASLVEVFAELKIGAQPNFKSAIEVTGKAIIAWAVAIAVLLMALGLIVRYIMLIILLILSPIPYVALAFPNAGKASKMWWQQFIKYLLYGPLALFLIVIALSASDLVGDVQIGLEGTGIDNILQAVIIIALAVASVMVPRKLGGSVTAVTLDFATKGAKRVGRRAGRAATYVPRKAGGAAAKTAKKYGQNLAGDAKDYAKKQYNARAPKALRADGRGKDGKLKAGRESIASRGLKKAFGDIPLNQEQRADVSRSAKAAESVRDQLAPLKTAERYGENVDQSKREIVRGSEAYRPSELQKEHVAKARTESAEERKLVIQHGSKQQAAAVLKHKSVVERMDEAEKNKIFNLEVNAPTNLLTNTDDSETNEANRERNTLNRAENDRNSAVIKQLQDTLAEIDKEQKGK